MPAYIAFGVLAVITVLMIYLPIRKDFTLAKLIINLFLVGVIVLIPLFIYLVSTIMSPESKSEAKLGAFDLFILTKIYLAPFILWAIAALYTTEVVHPKNVDRYWIMLGLFSGLVLSITMSIYGLISFGQRGSEGILMALVANPVYIPIWYAIRFWRLFKQSKLNKVSYLFAAISQLPFWGYATYQAKVEYLKLPEFMPDCFIATASSNGLPFIVGKSINYQHKGNSINVSQQMIHFWAFEKLWREKAPYSHIRFRRFYNIWGRKLANHINNPLLASVSFILLKPIEWIARIILKANNPTGKK
jgi:hypothetical protein